MGHVNVDNLGMEKEDKAPTKKDEVHIEEV